MMSDPVYMNKRAMLSAFLVAATLLYLIWTFSTGGRKSGIQMYNTWKTGSFVDIPQDVLDKQKNVKIDQRYITFPFEGQECKIYLQEVNGDKTTGLCVLLLHGMKFTSENWREIKTLDLLGSMGIRAVAVDLAGAPGSRVVRTLNTRSESFYLLNNHGIDNKSVVARVKTTVGKSIEIYLQEAKPVDGSLRTPISVLLLHGAGDSSDVWQQRKIRTISLLAASGFQTVAVDLPGWGKSKNAAAADKSDFLREFIKKVHLDRPVIVSPSMSGSFSIPFLMGKNAGGSCQDRTRGFVPIAPVHTEAYTHAQYHRCEVPTMIVYGTKDKSLGLHSVGNLRNLADNEIFPMETAGHACYLDKPTEWHYLIYNFLMALHSDPE